MSSSSAFPDINELERFRMILAKQEEIIHQGQNNALKKNRAQNPDRTRVNDLPNTSIIASTPKPVSPDELPDMTIQCGGLEFKAHRSVVCRQSSVFHKAIIRGGPEAATATHVVVSIAAERPEIMERFLQFLHTGHYDPLATTLSGINALQAEGAMLPPDMKRPGALVHCEDLFLPLRLYLMAKKYDVQALKHFARDRFHRAAVPVWRNRPYFLAAVDELYSNTSADDLIMRETVCELVVAGIRESGQRVRMAEVMGKHGEFAVGVLKHVLCGEKEGRAISKKTVKEPVGKPVHVTIS